MQGGTAAQRWHRPPRLMPCLQPPQTHASLRPRNGVQHKLRHRCHALPCSPAKVERSTQEEKMPASAFCMTRLRACVQHSRPAVMRCLGPSGASHGSMQKLFRHAARPQSSAAFPGESVAVANSAPFLGGNPPSKASVHAALHSRTKRPHSAGCAPRHSRRPGTVLHCTRALRGASAS